MRRGAGWRAGCAGGGVRRARDCVQPPASRRGRKHTLPGRAERRRCGCWTASGGRVLLLQSPAGAASSCSSTWRAGRLRSWCCCLLSAAGARSSAGGWCCGSSSAARRRAQPLSRREIRDEGQGCSRAARRGARAEGTHGSKSCGWRTNAEEGERKSAQQKFATEPLAGPRTATTTLPRALIVSQRSGSIIVGAGRRRRGVASLVSSFFPVKSKGR